MKAISHFLGAVVFALSGPALAQEHEGMAMDHTHQEELSTEAPMAEGSPMHGVLGIPETREGSGTGWQPDSTPMFAWHAMANGWMLMLHTNAFVGFDSQAGDRGDNAVFSANWIMGMAKHELGGGEIGFRTMLSLEPATVPEDGYPLLLQTGETFDGMPLHDRQHPHDLFMEVAATYRHALGDSLGVEVYVAPVGEPAIGPVAFPHRFTGMASPLAPLGHHWQDSTHITFGVMTAGVFTRHMKLEGSWFNGREPDENRWDFDLRTPDSFAARLSVNPTHDLSAQASYAFLKTPEELERDESLQRATASVAWNHDLGHENDVAVVGVLGHNDPEHGTATHSAMLEGTVLLSGHHLLFSRAEWLTKSGAELVLEPARAEDTFAMGAFSLGVGHDFDPVAQVVPGIGLVASLNLVGSDLEPVYGSQALVGAMVFVRLHAPQMKPSMGGGTHSGM